MLYRRLADVVVILHMLIGLFFFVGAPLVKLAPWLAILHIPLVLWVCAAFIMGWTCPLTPLENRLRRLAGDAGYEGSFVDRYLVPLFTLPNQKPRAERSRTGRRNEALLGIFLGLMVAVLYVGLFFKQIAG